MKRFNVYQKAVKIRHGIDNFSFKIRDLGIDERYIFIDKQSGRDFNRPQYQGMLLIIREGDLLYLDALDRLGRDYDGIIREWKYINGS